MAEAPAAWNVVSGTGEVGDPWVMLNPPQRFFDPLTDDEIQAFMAAPGVDSVKVTPEGRIIHRLTAVGACHLGYTGKCVTPPAVQAAYDHFNNDLGTVRTAEGDTIGVGPLSGDIGHTFKAKTVGAIKSHYNGSRDFSEAGMGRKTGVAPWKGHTTASKDNVGSIVGSVVYHVQGSEIFGVGALAPTMDRVRIEAMQRAGASGDWVSLGNGEELLLGSVLVPSAGQRGVARKKRPLSRMRSSSEAATLSNMPVDDLLEVESEHQACSCDNARLAASLDDMHYDAAGNPVLALSPLGLTRLGMSLQAAMTAMATGFSGLQQRVELQAGLLGGMGIIASSEPAEELLEQVAAASGPADGEIAYLVVQGGAAIAADSSAYVMTPIESVSAYANNEIVKLASGSLAIVTQALPMVDGSTTLIVRQVAADGQIDSYGDVVGVVESATTRTGMRAEWQSYSDVLVAKDRLTASAASADEERRSRELADLLLVEVAA